MKKNKQAQEHCYGEILALYETGSSEKDPEIGGTKKKKKPTYFCPEYSSKPLNDLEQLHNPL